MTFTENTRVCEVLDIDEKLEAVFEKHGLACLGCPGAASETLKEAAEGHGIDVAKLLADLNKET